MAAGPMDCSSKAQARRIGDYGDAVCRIVVKNEKGDIRDSGTGVLTGTGFLIGPNLIMTCHHVIPDLETAQRAEAQFFKLSDEVKRPSGGDRNPHSHAYVKFNPSPEVFFQSPALRDDGGYFLEADQNHLDYTILQLQSDTCLVGRVCFSLFDAKEPQLGNSCTIYQHPDVSSLDVSSGIKFIGAFSQATGNIVKLAEYECHYATPTADGSSGGPVVDAQGNLIALHYQGRIVEDSECAKPPGHVCNAGVLIRKIIEDLKQKGQKQALKRLCTTPLQIPNYGVISNLKKFYGAQKTIPLLMGGSLSIEHHYTSLAITTEQERKDKQGELRQADLRPTTYETIFQPKKAIRLEDLFERTELKESAQKRVLIQGSAGIGKSTLCQKIAYEWSQGNLWPQFKAVFWIKFRNLTTDRYPAHFDYTVDQVIKRECGFEMEQVGGPIEQEEFRKHCLVILDGYDELHAPEPRFKTPCGASSFILASFQQTFPHIVVTTRPQAVEDFHNKVNLEILGFEDEEIRTYIKNFFPNQKIGKPLLEKQLENPLIHSLCHIPINLEIFCSLASEGKIFPENRPFNLATVYHELTTGLIERFRKEYVERSSSRHSQTPRIADILDFVEMALEHIAWKMMETDTLFISNHQLQEIIRSLGAWNPATQDIDIRQIGPLKIDGNGEGEFIHLTFQEFFAAKYLSRLFPEQLEKAKQIISKKKFHPRYSLVFSMMSGILMKDQKALREFFNILYTDPRDLGGSRELILFARYFEECGDDVKEIELYKHFIPDVTRLLEDPQISNQIKFDILNRNHHLMNQNAIVELFVVKLEKTEVLFVQLVERLTKQKTRMPEQIIKSLSAILKNSRAGYGAKWAAAEALEVVVQEGGILSEETIYSLRTLLLDPNADCDVKEAAASILGAIALAGGAFPKEAIDSLIALFLDPNADLDAKWAAASALGAVAQAGGDLPKEAIDNLIALLLDPNADCDAKWAAASALGGIAQAGGDFAEKAIDSLGAFLLLDPKTESFSNVKRRVAHVLGRVAQAEGAFAEKAIDSLGALLLDPNADRNAKRASAQVLREVAQAKGGPAEKAINSLRALLLDPNADSNTKWSAAQSLGVVAQSKGALAGKAIDSLRDFLLDPKSDSDAKKAATRSLRAVAQAGEALAEEAIDSLRALLLDPNVDSDTKWAAASALGEVVQVGGASAEKAVDSLRNFLLDPEADLDAKRAAASALGEVAQAGGTPAEKAIDDLIVWLLNADSDTKWAAASALGDVAQARGPFAAKAVDSLRNLLPDLLDPNADRFVKVTAAQALGVIAQAGGALPEKAVYNMIAWLLDPNADNDIKWVAAQVLEAVPKGKGALPEKAVDSLMAFLLDPKADREVKRASVQVLGAVARAGGALPEKAVDSMIARLLDPNADNGIKWAVAQVLGAVPKGGGVLPEKGIVSLMAFLLDPKSDRKAKRAAAQALGAIAQAGGALAEEAVDRMIAWLLDTNADNDIKWAVAQALGVIAQARGAFAEKAINSLNAWLLYPLGPNIGGAAAQTLGAFAQAGGPLAEKAIDSLSDLLLALTADSNTKWYAALALGVVAQARGAFAEKAINSLNVWLLDPPLGPNIGDFTNGAASQTLVAIAQAGGALPEKVVNSLCAWLLDPLDPDSHRFAKTAAVQVLGALAQARGVLPEKIIGSLSTLLLDPYAGVNTKRYAVQALGALAQAGGVDIKSVLTRFSSISVRYESEYPQIKQALTMQLNFFQIQTEEDRSLVSRICRLYGIAFYEINHKFYIADEREIYAVRAHSNWPIELFARAVESRDLGQLQEIVSTYPELLDQLYKQGYVRAYVNAAICDNQLPILQWFYKQNAFLFLQICHGGNKTPLHIAAHLDRLDIGKWIDEKIPALLNELDHEGRTALDVAENARAEQFANWLILIGATKKEKDTSCVVM